MSQLSAFVKPAINGFIRRSITSSSDYIPNQIIQNYEYPACKDCVYFKKDQKFNYTSSSKCMKFGTKDLITGVVNYEYVINVRNFKPDKCGTKGIHFSKKEDNDYSTHT